MGITRRSFVAGLAAGLSIAGASPVAAVGLPAGPDLEAAFASMTALTEGRGRGVVHILYAPWCHASPSIYRESRKALSWVTLRWIPFSGGQPEGRESVEVLLRNMDPALIPSTFTTIRPLGDPMPTPLCDRQDAEVERLVAPLVIRDTGRVLRTPTLAYRFRDGRVRVIPGGIGLEEFRKIAELAS
jgi:hypothetical protein